MTATQDRLHDFEGREVHRTAIKIGGAGTGLNDALSIKPEEIREEEERYFVLKATCAQVAFKTDKKGVRSRIHTMDTIDIAVIGEDAGEKFLAAAAEEVRRAKDEIEGQLRLEADDDLEGAEAIASMHEGALSPEFKGAE